MFNRAEKLNRRAEQPQFKAEQIISHLAIKRGAIIADIGSGGGYFTIRFARETGKEGKVYAVDTNKRFLAYVKELSAENDLENIETVLISKGLQGLPEKGCDLVFLRNVFHHLNDTENYFRDLKKYLKPESIVVIIDYKKGKALDFIAFKRHYTEETIIIRTMKNAGYKLVRRYEFLPEQSFGIYQIA